MEQWCKFDLESYKQTALYSARQEEMGTAWADSHVPQITSYGTAPFCNVDKCEYTKNNDLFFQTSKAGDGNECASGNYFYNIYSIKRLQNLGLQCRYSKRISCIKS
jgi:hypothetical protein